MFQPALANTGDLFSVTATGIPASFSIQLCLNGKGALSCQNYTVSHQTLSIRTLVPGHSYPNVGLKLLTAGYALNTGCSSIENGYCIFAVSDTSPATVAIAQTTTTVPGAPTTVVATAGNAQASISWTAPGSDGGSPITSYTVTSSTGGHTCTATAPTTTCDITGLTNGTSYFFTVTASNVNGVSPESLASNIITPANVPGAPTGVSGTAGNAQVVVSWTAPASTGGSAITSYTVTSSVGGHTCTATAPATTCTVTGLTNGIAYTFSVTASNASGTGPSSTPSSSVAPSTVPGAPTGVSGTAGNAQVVVSWTAPASTGGSAISSYTVSSSAAGYTCTATAPATTCTVTGLTNGTAYTFTVRASNATGAGSASTASSAVTPSTVPSAPTGVSGTSGNGQVTVTWTAASANGATVTSYTATSNAGQSCTALVPATSCTISGLTNGTAYTFTVKATNVNGQGPASAVSSPVTPSTVPDAPTAVAGTAGDGAVSLTWTAPADTGGSAITSYTATTVVGPIAACTATAPATGCTVAGLTNGNTYSFRVTATNANGTGSASSSSGSVTPNPTLPGTPTISSVSAGNSQVSVSWLGVAGATGYTVATGQGAQTCSSSLASPTSCTVSGLINGTSYTFTVRATNGLFSGAASAPSSAVTPYGSPSAPASVVAVPGNALVTVSWNPANANGGAPLTYTVTSTGGGTCSTQATACTISGLTNGVTYNFQVQAANNYGQSGGFSSVASATPSTVPNAPTGVTATRVAAGTVVVIWTPVNAANTGGSPITGYVALSNPGGFTCTTLAAGNNCTISGLTPGTSYTFTVSAANANGQGPASAPSTPVVEFASSMPDTASIEGSRASLTALNLDSTDTQTGLTESKSGLTLSLNHLALSSLGGVARIITVTNTTDTEVSLGRLNIEGLPNDTRYTTTCTEGDVLAAKEGACSITIQPGHLVNEGEGGLPCTQGVMPKPGTITLNTSLESISAQVLVLGYGCVYQGGYVFALDDATPNSMSVGGAVVTLIEEPQLISWKPLNAAENEVVGIDETSTPDEAHKLGCYGNTDGACNTQQIALSYATENSADYAAGLCQEKQHGYADWYLPSICEMGYDANLAGSGCGTKDEPTMQNIQSSLMDKPMIENLTGIYWSATQCSLLPSSLGAWIQAFDGVLTQSYQFYGDKGTAYRVLCVRKLTPKLDS